MEAIPPIHVIQERLDSALQSLATHDSYLVRLRLNERTITHKLAEHLQAAFPLWDVDCEYNRYGPDPKVIAIPNQQGEYEDSPIYPDIIIHKRGDWRHLDNPPHCMVIEARKSECGQGKIDRDCAKVEAYLTQELRYHYGAIIELSFVEEPVPAVRARVECKRPEYIVGNARTTDFPAPGDEAEEML